MRYKKYILNHKHKDTLKNDDSGKHHHIGFAMTAGLVFLAFVKGMCVGKVISHMKEHH